MTRLRTTLCPFVFAALIAACGTTTPSPTPDTAAILPPVDGFTYARPGPSAAIFEDAFADTLDEDPSLQILQAATAIRGDDEVLVMALTFPNTTDTQGVDAMARILDGLEDSFQAGSERGLGGEAYLIRAENETIVMAPWGRTDQLVFLFALGPDQATQDLAASILGGG